MKSLPSNVTAYSKTPVFNEATIPKGLLKDHNTKEGVWGVIVILAGELEYTILEPVREIVILSQDLPGIVEPTVLHFIKPLAAVSLYVEFYR